MPSCLSRLSAVFRLCAPALLLLLAGCAMTRYEYVPPAGEAGAQCIARCAETRDSCREDEFRRAEWAREACERRNWWNYRFCTMGAFTRREAWACERHLRSCWVSDSSWRCDDDYRQCYSACGGRVIKITE